MILLIVHNSTVPAETFEEAVKKQLAPQAPVPGVATLPNAPAAKVETFTVRDDLNATLETLECHLVERALIKHDYNQVKAAEFLGITRGALQYKMKKYRLEADKEAA